MQKSAKTNKSKISLDLLIRYHNMLVHRIMNSGMSFMKSYNFTDSQFHEASENSKIHFSL